MFGVNTLPSIDESSLKSELRCAILTHESISSLYPVVGKSKRSSHLRRVAASFYSYACGKLCYNGGRANISFHMVCPL